MNSSLFISVSVTHTSYVALPVFLIYKGVSLCVSEVSAAICGYHGDCTEP